MIVNGYAIVAAEGWENLSEGRNCNFEAVSSTRMVAALVRKVLDNDYPEQGQTMRLTEFRVMPSGKNTWGDNVFATVEYDAAGHAVYLGGHKDESGRSIRWSTYMD